MWSNLPSDLLSNIFLFLSPDSFACANATCRNWHQACDFTLKIHSFSLKKHLYSPWFVALPLRNNTLSCYAHNPTNERWYELSLDFLPYPIRLISHLKGILLVKPSIATTLHLGLCNPFTKQYKSLPRLNTQRTNPAVGFVFTTLDSSSSHPCCEIYVAGGMSEAPLGGATYEPTLEMYDPQRNAWRVVGTMPMEYAVRLTVWTPEESVYCDGALYWMTSARAYSLMAYDVKKDKWREHSVPMAEKLEFAALVLRKGKVTLVGGTRVLGGCVWELIISENEGRERWVEVEKVPSQIGRMLRGEKGSWERTKCVGGDGGVYLYRELCGGMVVWREVQGSCSAKWEWVWVEGCEFIRGKQVRNLQIKGVLVRPNLCNLFHFLVNQIEQSM